MLGAWEMRIPASFECSYARRGGPELLMRCNAGTAWNHRTGRHQNELRPFGFEHVPDRLFPQFRMVPSFGVDDGNLFRTIVLRCASQVRDTPRSRFASRTLGGERLTARPQAFPNRPTSPLPHCQNPKRPSRWPIVTLADIKNE